jgi:hypothetical protein
MYFLKKILISIVCTFHLKIILIVCTFYKIILSCIKFTQKKLISALRPYHCFLKVFIFLNFVILILSTYAQNIFHPYNYLLYVPVFGMNILFIR